MKQTSNFEVSGKLINVGPLETRTSRAGKEYQIREIELDLTDNEYPNYVVLQMLGKSAGYAEGFNPGDYVAVSCSLKGSQGQDGRRWTNVNAFYIAAQVPDLPLGDESSHTRHPSPSNPAPSQKVLAPAPIVFPAPQEEENDLPF